MLAGRVAPLVAIILIVTLLATRTMSSKSRPVGRAVPTATHLAGGLSAPTLQPAVTSSETLVPTATVTTIPAAPPTAAVTAAPLSQGVIGPPAPTATSLRVEPPTHTVVRSGPVTPTRVKTVTRYPTAAKTAPPTITRTPTGAPTSPSTDTRTLTPMLTLTRIPTATRSAVPSATATIGREPGASRSGGCYVFPADNIWNRNIAALPTHVRSDAYVATIGRGAPLHTAFGSGEYNGEPLGMSFITVPGDQPRVPIHFDYSSESDPGPYPIPTNAPIEGGPNSDGDRHVAVVDRDACVLYELYHARPNADGSWDAGSGVRWNLGSNALRPDGWTSADAAGLPILPLMVRYDEIASGVIRHALRFTAPTTGSAHIWPARHDAGDSHDPDLPPMGIRVRLKASFDISSYSHDVRVILQALKDYGMFLADNGTPSWNIDGINDSRWNNAVLKQLETIEGSNLEVVDESGLMIDPNSAQSR